MLVRPSIGWSVHWLVHPSVGPHITLKTGYVAIASRRGEGRGNQLMLKTGYVEIALRLVTVDRSCFSVSPSTIDMVSLVKPSPYPLPSPHTPRSIGRPVGCSTH
jgi:hypothetical protein